VPLDGENNLVVGKTQIGNSESNGPNSMKSNIRLKFQIWAPALFSGVLCFLLQHFDDGKLASMNPAFPAFISFLPMAFVFVGFSMNNFVNRMEKRLDDLEHKIDTRP
jgi:hypothetical protein